MSDELISKDNILKTIREWTNEYIPQTLYGDGYDDAVKDIIKLIETEIPVNAVELPCKIGDIVWGIRHAGRNYLIKEAKVSDMYFSDNMELVVVIYNVCRGIVGKHIFRTKEEAEAALKKRIGGAETSE